VTTVIVVFLFGALWKPWAPPPGSRPLVQGPIPTASPIPSTLPIDELAELRRECDEPGGWRVYSREGFLDRIVRVWRSVEPAPAPAGPLDPAIPLVQAGPANEALGYCAPWSGPERPPADSVVTAWQVALGAGRPGSPAPDSAIPVRLIRILPARASVLGAVYEGPGGKPGALDGRTGGGWTVGRYVFAIRATGWERWWSVEISGPGPNRPGASSAP
jgi:hypothetical protein